MVLCADRMVLIIVLIDCSCRHCSCFDLICVLILYLLILLIVVVVVVDSSSSLFSSLISSSYGTLIIDFDHWYGAFLVV